MTAFLLSIALWQSIWPALMLVFVPFSIAYMATLAVTDKY